jgi:uncharacterized membrane protein
LYRSARHKEDDAARGTPTSFRATQPPLVAARCSNTMAFANMPPMDTFTHLLHHKPVVFIHLFSALGALLLGIGMFIGRKGSTLHRRLGWTWVALMASATLTSVFIRDSNLPTLAGFSPIHLLTVLTAFGLYGGIRAIRRGQVAEHRSRMTSLFVGACVIAGAFTLLPGRFLGHWLWHDMLGLIA